MIITSFQTKGVPMRVKVELIAPATADGLAVLSTEWRNRYPEAVIENISSYGKFNLTLVCPPATQVIQPQLVDLTATSVE